jgi:GR25 family glycosyltransferase involved in LPS biosynthesis
MTGIISKISAAIVAHPGRIALAETIQDLVSWDALHDIPTKIFMDNEGIGCDDNHLRAWEYLSRQDGEWLMVLEDDVSPVDDFVEQLHRALDAAPAPIVSFYLGRTRPAFYQERIAHALVGCSHPGPDDPVDMSTPWLVSNRLFSQQCVAIRRDVLRGMIRMLPEFVHRERAIDQGMTAYMRSASLPVAYSVPSLVDHLDGQSYARHADQNPVHGPRVAWCTGKRSEWTSEFRIM